MRTRQIQNTKYEMKNTKIWREDISFVKPVQKYEARHWRNLSLGLFPLSIETLSVSFNLLHNTRFANFGFVFRFSPFISFFTIWFFIFLYFHIFSTFREPNILFVNVGILFRFKYFLFQNISFFKILLPRWQWLAFWRYFPRFLSKCWMNLFE